MHSPSLLKVLRNVASPQAPFLFERQIGLFRFDFEPIIARLLRSMRDAFERRSGYRSEEQEGFLAVQGEPVLDKKAFANNEAS